MQAETATLAPTDAEIFALEAAHTKRHETRDCTGYFSEFDIVAFTLAAIAKWGAPAPANFPARITALLHEVKRGPWEDASGEPLQDDAAAALAWIAAPPAQEARLNPDMPVQELRLHMGELTSDEVLAARSAIRWANSQKEARVPLNVDALAQEIRRVDGNHSLGAGALAEALLPWITAAQKETS